MQKVKTHDQEDALSVVARVSASATSGIGVQPDY